jgi:uncharacterized protein YceK
MRRRLFAYLIACSLVSGGCGTYADVMCGQYEPDGPFFYRGVRADLDSKSYVLFADIPLSAVADTVLIPCGFWAMAYMSSHPFPTDQKEFMRPASDVPVDSESVPAAPTSPLPPRLR